MYAKSKVKEYILSKIDYPKASAVLDIGCGRGSYEKIATIFIFGGKL